MTRALLLFLLLLLLPPILVVIVIHALRQRTRAACRDGVHYAVKCSADCCLFDTWPFGSLSLSMGYKNIEHVPYRIETCFFHLMDRDREPNGHVWIGRPVAPHLGSLHMIGIAYLGLKFTRSDDELSRSVHDNSVNTISITPYWLSFISCQSSWRPFQDAINSHSATLLCTWSPLRFFRDSSVRNRLVYGSSLCVCFVKALRPTK